jgi:DNA replication and repair protein RecF
MSYFSLIFAYIELFSYNSKGVYPVVLLDDVSGELDKKRWGSLIEYLKGRQFQVFITTANENFKTELEKLHNSKNILVSEGQISPQ